MVSDKEKLLVVLVFARVSRTIVVVGESEAVFDFAKSLAKEVVEAVRTADVDVHPHAVAEYVVTRLNRFASAETRDSVIQEALEVGQIAAVQEQEALIDLGLANEGLRGAPPAAPPQNAVDPPVATGKRIVGLNDPTRAKRRRAARDAVARPDIGASSAGSALPNVGVTG